MTPAPQNGSPEKNASVKQQRAEQRAKKLEEYHRKQKRAVRNRRIGIGSAIAGGVAVLALIVTTVVLTPQAPKAAEYSEGGTGAKISGVKTYDNSNGHVQTPVTYKQTPPVGGEHNPAWLNCGVYSKPVPNENAVHSLEHGAVWVTYDPSMKDADLDTLRTALPSTYSVISPYKGIDSPIVLSAWNKQLKVTKADDPRVAKFFEEYWKGDGAPEPGAPCTGGIDAPGKTS